MESNEFFFFDELNYYRNLYEESGFEPRNELYKIHSRFMMDSEFTTSQSNKPNRKRKMTNNSGNWLSQTSTLIEKIWKNYEKQTRISSAAPPDNNVEARGMIKNAPDFPDLSSSNTSSLGIQKLNDHAEVPNTSQEAILFKNETGAFTSLNFKSSGFIIPPDTSFVMSDVNVVRQFTNYGMRFDLVVMDPPWSNKSVKRKKVYDWFDIHELKQLPIAELLKENGLIIVWLTNNQKVHENMPEIFEHWGLKEVAMWHWLKVTKNGDPVYRFNSAHKVPYESLIFACREEFFEEWKQKLKRDFCIISTPNASHSRKPPIASILKRLNIFQSESCLELYARYLLPGTTSVGLECIKFQDVYYFKKE